MRVPKKILSLVLMVISCSAWASDQVVDSGKRLGAGGNSVEKLKLQRAELEKMKGQLRSLPSSDKKRDLERILVEIEQRLAKREDPKIRFLELPVFFENSDTESREYFYRLQSRVEDCGSTHFPSDGRKSLYGRAVVSIHIDREGILKSAELLSSSKSIEVDKHALKVVSASAPFGKVPEALAVGKYTEFAFSFAFDFHNDGGSPYVSKLPEDERCNWAHEKVQDAATTSQVASPFASRSASGQANETARAPQNVEPSTRGMVNKPPIYPLESKRNGEQGRVVVKALIDVHGRASQAAVRESSGHPLLDQAAMEAIKSWSFIPARRNGIPVSMEYDIPINFVLQ